MATALCGLSWGQWHEWINLLGPNSPYLQLHNRSSSLPYPKQLKDRWSINNRKITLFNGFYNHLHVVRLSEADDLCSLNRPRIFSNNPDKTDFKMEHIGHVLRHPLRWCVWHSDDDSRDGSKRSCLNLDDYSSASLDSGCPPRSIGCYRKKSSTPRKRPATKTHVIKASKVAFVCTYKGYVFYLEHQEPLFFNV